MIHKYNLHIIISIILLLLISQTLFLVNPVIGTITNIFIVTYLLILTVISGDKRSLLAPVIILYMGIYAGLVLPFDDIFIKTVVIYEIMFGMGILYRYYFSKDNRSPIKRISFLFSLPVVILMGIFLGIIQHLFFSSGYNFGLVALEKLVLVAPFLAYTEELVFRRLLQFEAGKITHPVFACLFSATVYTLMYVRPETVNLSFVFAVNVVLGIIWMLSENIYLSTLANALTKITFFIFAFGIIK